MRLKILRDERVLVVETDLESDGPFSILQEFDENGIICKEIKKIEGRKWKVALIFKSDYYRESK